MQIIYILQKLYTWIFEIVHRVGDIVQTITGTLLYLFE
jgi:hypothetical protein